MISQRAHVSLRSRDVVLVLAAAQDCGKRRSLFRIEVQKFVYLLDTFGRMWAAVASPHFATYKNGPYDFRLQSALDSLSFRGFVRASDVRVKDSVATASYSLTAGGHALYREIAEHFPARDGIARRLATRLSGRWRNIIPLVYAEPAYLQERIRGHGVRLSPDTVSSTSAAQLVLEFKRIVISTIGIEPGPSVLEELLFEFLMRTRGPQ